MISRFLRPRLEAALSDNPVVMLHGARQVGKSTLAEAVAAERGMRNLTLDRAAVLAAARESPESFVAGLDGPTLIDEVQRAPDLARAIKLAVDADRTPGRFLLTGSTNVFQLPRLSESLVGRMEVVVLRPFAQCELSGMDSGFIARLFSKVQGPPSVAERASPPEVWERVLRGGYPPVQERALPERRHAWFDSYVATILERDVRDLADVGSLVSLTRLLQLLAGRIGTLLNYSSLSRGLGSPQTTLRRHFELLEQVFLITLLPAWSGNRTKVLTKSAKLYLVDTGLVAGLLALDRDRLEREPSLRGSLLENFVVTELIKQASWSTLRPKLFHYRTQAGVEVDVVVEASDGTLAGVEIKSSASVDSSDFRALRSLREDLGPRFRSGVVLYTGAEPVAFGPDLRAEPISALWA